MEKYAENPRGFTIQVGLTEWEFDPKATLEMGHQRTAQIIGTHYRKAYEQCRSYRVPTSSTEPPEYRRNKPRWYRVLRWIASKWPRFRESEFWTVLSEASQVTYSFSENRMPEGTFSAIAWITFANRVKYHGDRITSIQVSAEMAGKIRDTLVSNEPAWTYCNMGPGLGSTNRNLFARVADMDVVINPFLKGESILPVFEV